MQTIEDRREFKRFMVKDASSFVTHANWPDKGVLVDISKGGLAFHYNSEVPWGDETADCMVVGDHNSSLSSIPTTLVDDRLVPCGQGQTMVVRRRSLKFGALNEQQRVLLDCFIWINSVAHC